eukprot:m.265982 g.265982  ORF g.265982 m.265982 type:complete len:187 (-) comp19269_c0_seq1:33-593(-)
MWYYDNKSTAAYTYLALHGSYGLCWLLKDRVFPDAQFEQPITLTSSALAFACVLGPYWTFPYLLISDSARPEPSACLLAGCTVIHTLGVAIMLAADSQKYFTLKHKRGLITTGMFSLVRHPNYTGEMMIYGSYAALVGGVQPWAVLAFVWGCVFATNMAFKEASMSRYAEWKDYKSCTNFIIPFLL